MGEERKPFDMDDLYSMLSANIDGANDTLTALIDKAQAHGPQAVLMGIAGALATLIALDVLKRPKALSPGEFDVLTTSALCDLMDIHRQMIVQTAIREADKATSH